MPAKELVPKIVFPKLPSVPNVSVSGLFYGSDQIMGSAGSFGPTDPSVFHGTRVVATVVTGSTTAGLFNSASIYGTSPIEGEIQALATEVASLRGEIHRLADAVNALAHRGVTDEEAVTREISPEDARDEIIAFMKGSGPAYPSDIARALNLDYDLVTETLESLRREGDAEPTITETNERS
jgi:hypothetical protein